MTPKNPLPEGLIQQNPGIDTNLLRQASELASRLPSAPSGAQFNIERPFERRYDERSAIVYRNK